MHTGYRAIEYRVVDRQVLKWCNGTSDNVKLFSTPIAAREAPLILG